MSPKRLSARIGSGPAATARISVGSIASNAARAGGERSERARPDRQSPIAAECLLDLGEAHRGKFRAKNVGIVGQPLLAVRHQPVELHSDRLDMRGQHCEKRRRLATAVEPGDRLQRLRIGRQAMFLPVVDHLDAMLGGP